MLPGCRSAWKKLCRKTWVKKISAPRSASCSRSNPASRSASTSSTGMPSIRSRTSTSRVVWDQWTSGTSSSPVPRNWRRRVEAAAPSRSMSSSSKRIFSNSATTATGWSQRTAGTRRSARRATTRSSPTSRRITFSSAGRTTLTTTRAPPGSRAGCTWAMEAEASGVSPNSSNASSTGKPSERSTIARATVPGNGGTWSRSSASSAATSSGTRSGRAERACPNFTKMGPRVSRVLRTRTARGSRPAS